MAEDVEDEQLRDEPLHRAELDRQARHGLPVFEKDGDKTALLSELSAGERAVLDRLGKVDQNNTY